MRKRVERDSQRDAQASRQQWDAWTQRFREPGRRVELNAGVMRSDQVLDAGFGDAVLRYTNARSLIREGFKQRGQHKRAGAANTGPRKSRYAGQYPEWLRIAQQACCGLDGTLAARQRKVTSALAKAQPKVRRRTLATFVLARWADIVGARSKADRNNLSI